MAMCPKYKKNECPYLRNCPYGNHPEPSLSEMVFSFDNDMNDNSNNTNNPRKRSRKEYEYDDYDTPKATEPSTKKRRLDLEQKDEEYYKQPLGRMVKLSKKNTRKAIAKQRQIKQKAANKKQNNNHNQPNKTAIIGDEEKQASTSSTSSTTNTTNANLPSTPSTTNNNDTVDLQPMQTLFEQWRNTIFPIHYVQALELRLKTAANLKPNTDDDHNDAFIITDVLIQLIYQYLHLHLPLINGNGRGLAFKHLYNPKIGYELSNYVECMQDPTVNERFNELVFEYNTTNQYSLFIEHPGDILKCLFYVRPIKIKNEWKNCYFKISIGFTVIDKALQATFTQLVHSKIVENDISNNHFAGVSIYKNVGDIVPKIQFKSFNIVCPEQEIQLDQNSFKMGIMYLFGEVYGQINDGFVQRNCIPKIGPTELLRLTMTIQNVKVQSIVERN